MNFFDVLNSLYTKKKPIFPVEHNYQLCITMNKWLGLNKDNLQAIKKILPLMFYIQPKHYFYLLFFNIPRLEKVPYIKKVEKVKQKENKLLNEIQEVLNWSKREMKLNEKILEKTILTNKKYWKEEIGV